MRKFYRICFFAYKVALVLLIILSTVGASFLGLPGLEDGLDATAAIFITGGSILIILGLILQFVHLPLKLKHVLRYIVTLLIFGTVLYNAFFMYNFISDDDYSIVFFFSVLFTILAFISFYAVIAKKISPASRDIYL